MSPDQEISRAWLPILSLSYSSRPHCSKMVLINPAHQLWVPRWSPIILGMVCLLVPETGCIRGKCSL